MEPVLTIGWLAPSHTRARTPASGQSAVYPDRGRRCCHDRIIASDRKHKRASAPEVITPVLAGAREPRLSHPRD